MSKTAIAISSQTTFDALSIYSDQNKILTPIGEKIIIGSFDLLFLGIISDKLPHDGFNGLKSVRPAISFDANSMHIFDIAISNVDPTLSDKNIVFASMQNNIIKLNILSIEARDMMLSCSINILDIANRFRIYWTSREENYMSDYKAYYSFKETLTYKSNIEQTYKSPHLLRAENYQKFQYIVENYQYKIDITNVDFTKMHIWLAEHFGISREFYIIKNTLYMKSEANAVLFKLEN